MTVSRLLNAVKYCKIRSPGKGKVC